MFFSQIRFNFSFLLVCFALVTQVLSIRLEIQPVNHGDGTYSYQGVPQSNVRTPSPDRLRNWVQQVFRAMKRDARRNGITSPGAISILFITTGNNEGSVIIQSSIKGAGSGQTSSLTSELLNTCVNQGNHRTYGNCAEMGALAVAHQAGLSVRGSAIAVYGEHGHVEGWLAPCRDGDGYWGCGTYCSQSEVHAITKRSRIEGESSSDGAEEEMVVVLARDPKLALKKASSPKLASTKASSPKSPTKTPSRKAGQKFAKVATTFASMPTYPAKAPPAHTFAVTLN